MGLLAEPAANCNRGIFRIVKVLVTGASGFICGYLIQELLDNGYEVVGLDNFSKYGRLQKSYDSHPRYKLVEGDAKDAALMKELLADCDHFIAAAATAQVRCRPKPHGNINSPGLKVARNELDKFVLENTVRFHCGLSSFKRRFVSMLNWL